MIANCRNILLEDGSTLSKHGNHVIRELQESVVSSSTEQNVPFTRVEIDTLLNPVNEDKVTGNCQSTILSRQLLFTTPKSVHGRLLSLKNMTLSTASLNNLKSFQYHLNCLKETVK